MPGGRELTLGERKSAARGRRRELLDRLLRDPDESVLTILLGNPRITEADVVRLAARRPTTAAAQRTILRSERFIARYNVKRALVFNPYTPTDLAARLVVLLDAPRSARGRRRLVAARRGARRRRAKRCRLDSSVRGCEGEDEARHEAERYFLAAGSEVLAFSVSSGFFGRHFDLVVRVRRALEVLDALAERITDLRQLAGAEHQQDDDEQDDQLAKSEAHGHVVA